MALIEIVPYKSSWPKEFAGLGLLIREALGDNAIAIHHIGSTSVPSMPAKDVIDIQITVRDFSETLQESLGNSGFVLTRFRQDHCPPGQILSDEELAKRLFNGPGRRSNIHVRQQGRFNQRYPLLCRDYLRSNESAANAYATVKSELARYFPDNVDAYYDIKDPVFDVIMAGASAWARLTNWSQPPSDAWNTHET